MKPRTGRLVLGALAKVITVGAIGLLATTCGDDDDEYDGLASDECRLHPEDCNGGAGSYCDDHDDCGPSLFCCEEDNNCGGGMCTADCRDDRDCPGDMLCEHDMCFYACDDDRDCAEGMSCEHDRTVCEYP